LLIDVRQDIRTTIQSKKGLENLVKFYQADPEAQAKVQSEVTNITTVLDKLREKRTTLENYLTETKKESGSV